tara:strand:- start:715 stop:1746 length:1032 start_codon:yes stop_codon:yes gene_type:complete
MKTLKTILLSSVIAVLAFAPVKSGEVSVSGSMEISNTTGLTGSNAGGKLGQENELSVTASTELDNGTTVSYKQSITQDNGRNDSELKFGTSYGTIAMTSTGTPIDAIDNIVPTAFEEAFHGATTWTSVGSLDGTFGIRFTNSDALPLGLTIDAMYQPQAGAGDAANDEGTSSTGHQYYGDAHDVVIKGPVPLIDGANFAVGTSNTEGLNATERGDRDEYTAALTYAFGPVSVGFQKGLILYDLESDVGTDWIKNTFYGIAYAVNDNLSVSYQNNESQKKVSVNGVAGATKGSSRTNTAQESEGFSVAYTVGGLKIAYVDNSHDNESYGSTEKDYRQVVLGVSF